jgi:L-lactate dehydrogenase
MGAVGTAIAYACLIRGSAGALSLYDINAEKVRAEVLDLNHGSLYVPRCPVSGSDDIAVTAGSAIVVVTAGAKQRPGQSRLELAATNAAMAQHLVPRLLEQSPTAIVLLVTNPVDVVTYAAEKAADVEAGRVFGSGTVLDSSRFRYLIAQRANLAVESVHGLIVGEHGDSEIPLWSSVSIGGLPADRIFDEATRDEITRGVVQSADEIIAGKGATSLAIGLSTARIIEAIRGNERFVMSVSTTQQGAYDISGVALSLPTVVSRAGAGEVMQRPLSDGEIAGLRASARTLHDVQHSLGL